MAKRLSDWVKDSLYRQHIKHFPICTIDVLFFDKSKKKILLCKRVNKPLKNKFFSIGGRLLKNESFLNGAIRQAKKELNINLKPAKLVFGGVINEIHPDSIYKKINYHAVNVYWGCIFGENEKNNFHLDNQHADYAWFDIKSGILHPYIKEKIANLSAKL